MRERLVAAPPPQAMRRGPCLAAQGSPPDESVAAKATSPGRKIGLRAEGRPSIHHAGAVTTAEGRLRQTPHRTAGENAQAPPGRQACTRASAAQRSVPRRDCVLQEGSAKLPSAETVTDHGPVLCSRHPPQGLPPHLCACPVCAGASSIDLSREPPSPIRRFAARAGAPANRKTWNARVGWRRRRPWAACRWATGRRVLTQ